LPQNGTEAITNATLKIVLQDQPIQGMNPEAYDWLRLRAAGVLAQLGSVGNENKVHNAILSLVGKLKLLDDRCDAATLLAKLTYNGAKIDAAMTSERLLKLASDVGVAELARAITFEGNPATAVYTGRDSGRGEPEFSDTGAGAQGKYPRQPLLAHLLALQKLPRSMWPAIAIPSS
jgi:hypothetical protein